MVVVVGAEKQLTRNRNVNGMFSTTSSYYPSTATSLPHYLTLRHSRIERHQQESTWLILPLG